MPVKLPVEFKLTLYSSNANCGHQQIKTQLSANCDDQNKTAGSYTRQVYVQ